MRQRARERKGPVEIVALGGREHERSPQLALVTGAKRQESEMRTRTSTAGSCWPSEDMR